MSFDDPWNHQEEIVSLCLKYIETNGDKFLKSNKFSKLQKIIVFDIIRSPTLSVTTEMNVFEAAVKWLKHNKSKSTIVNRNRKKIKTVDLKKDIFSHIRFTSMTIADILGSVKKQKIFSDSELLNLVEYIHNGTPLLSSIMIDTNPRNPPSVIKQDFKHKRDFDKNGIIYYIGTEYEKNFVNPRKTGKVRICTTTTNTESMASRILTSRKLHIKGWIGYSSNWSNSNQPWMSIDFGPHRKIKLSHYTLIHSWPSPLDSLRNWVIEGCNPSILGQRYEERELKENNSSEDEDHPFVYTDERIGHSFDEEHIDWILLDERKDDTSLNKGWATNTWHVSDISNAYRMFRIKCVGPDKSGTSYLSIGGIELYGSLFTYKNIDPTWDY